MPILSPPTTCGQAPHQDDRIMQIQRTTVSGTPTLVAIVSELETSKSPRWWSLGEAIVPVLDVAQGSLFFTTS